MYIISEEIKQNAERRWALPDRAFFAAGACHILAYAFLERYPSLGFEALWIKPASNFRGHHIFVSNGECAFDYHGFLKLDRLLTHTKEKAERWWEGWDCDLVPLPQDILISETKSREYDGLWLREPEQFLHNALPRAERFLDRFSLP